MPLCFYYPCIINYWGGLLFLCFYVLVNFYGNKVVSNKKCWPVAEILLMLCITGDRCSIKPFTVFPKYGFITRPEGHTAEVRADYSMLMLLMEYNPLGRAKLFFWWGFNTLNECIYGPYCKFSQIDIPIIDFWWGLLVSMWSVIGCWSPQTKVFQYLTIVTRSIWPRVSQNLSSLVLLS